MSPFDKLDRIFEGPIQAYTRYRYYRVAAHRFLAYLEKGFPDVRHLSELRRDPHLLGWIHGLCEQDPPLSNFTRRIYLIALRRLLKDLAGEGQVFEPDLILPEDFPPRPPHVPRWKMKKDLGPELILPADIPPPRQQARLRRNPAKPPHSIFQNIFDAHIETLATTLRPSTIRNYRGTVRHFLTYLQTEFPGLCHLSELRRAPHLLGWFRRLCDKKPPLSNGTRQEHLLKLRRLLDDLAFQGHPLQPALIVPEDIPPIPQRLPRPLSPEQDQKLQNELRRTDDLFSNALLLTRATGIRIGECMHLSLDCLQSLGDDQRALHVPIGKLYTERLVPADENICQLIARILSLRQQAPAPHQRNAVGFLLPRSGSFPLLYRGLRLALQGAAARIDCQERITPHRLRHTFATEMIRLGVSLPGLMQLLGHKTIKMTMRYVQVTQRDLQREFHSARHNAISQHQIPELPIQRALATAADLPAIHRTLAATRYLLEMYRRQLRDEKLRRKLQHLHKRLGRVADELDRYKPEK
jgi:site-specific recombinase XerD